MAVPGREPKAVLGVVGIRSAPAEKVSATGAERTSMRAAKHRLESCGARWDLGHSAITKAVTAPRSRCNQRGVDRHHDSRN
jgi:hypothetical protein